MNVSVRLFARARDLAGSTAITLELTEPATVADLRSALLQARPQLQPLAASLLVAVGTEYAPDNATIAAGTEIAVFPPVSGG